MNPIESIAAAKGQWARFDKATEGIAPERKAEIQRLIANLGLTADDPAVIAAALLGHLAKAGERIPEDIRLAGAEASDSFKDASRHSIQSLREVIAALTKITPSLRNQISEDIREEAHLVVRDALDKLAEGSRQAVAQAEERALTSAKKQFAEHTTKLLSGMDERLAIRESVTFWKGAAYAALVVSGALLVSLVYLLLA